ncbi:MAG: hypothetical protein ACRD7E_19565, partial [Bryobacteraceae bacterium]
MSTNIQRFLADGRRARTMPIDCGSTQGEFNTGRVRAFDVTLPIGSSPWLFLSPAAKRSRVQLEHSSTSLATLAGVYQWIT